MGQSASRTLADAAGFVAAAFLRYPALCMAVGRRAAPRRAPARRLCSRFGLTRTILAPQRKTRQPLARWHHSINLTGRLQRFENRWIGRVHTTGQCSECWQYHAPTARIVLADNSAGAADAAFTHFHLYARMKMAGQFGPCLIGLCHVAQDHAADRKLCRYRAAASCFHCGIVIAGDPHPVGCPRECSQHAFRLRFKPGGACRVVKIIAQGENPACTS